MVVPPALAVIFLNFDRPVNEQYCAWWLKVDVCARQVVVFGVESFNTVLCVVWKFLFLVGGRLFTLANGLINKQHIKGPTTPGKQC